LQQLAMSRQSLSIPAAQERRFREQFYPRLRHAASLTSSDGSYSLPAISPPTLVLGASIQRPGIVVQDGTAIQLSNLANSVSL